MKSIYVTFDDDEIQAMEKETKNGMSWHDNILSKLAPKYFKAMVKEEHERMDR